ncbi:hypothetical protein HAX54_048577 [Datura stramonium]|uniref:Uncharacterized protein n=1 Tax=Datura stramonium TaxID=4076 RepID=A0ABS8WN54_DATST|nr:hypothetical protein [Datura stramonium]
MERGSATVYEETEKSLLDKINKMEEEIAMTRRRIEQIDQNKESLLVKTEEIDQQLDWVKRKITRIDMEIAVSLRALNEVFESLPAQERNSGEIEQLLREFTNIMKDGDKEVSPEGNNTKERFGATPNDESFWPVRFTQGNEQITLKTHFRNYLRDPDVISCSTIYQTLQSLGILHPIEGGGSRCDPRDEYKRCAYHIDHRGHTTDECSVLRDKIHEMINSGKIRHMWGPHTILACDQVKLETPITKDARIHLLDYIALEESYAMIY